MSFSEISPAPENAALYPPIAGDQPPGGAPPPAPAPIGFEAQGNVNIYTSCIKFVALLINYCVNKDLFGTKYSVFSKSKTQS